MLYVVSDGLWNLWDVECYGCRMFGMWDVCDVGCFGMRDMECGMFAGMWGVYLKDPDIGMSDVRDVGCSWCGMFRIWDVRDVRCGMWDTGLQNSNIFWYFADFLGVFHLYLKLIRLFLLLTISNYLLNISF